MQVTKMKIIYFCFFLFTLSVKQDYAQYPVSQQIIGRDSLPLQQPIVMNGGSFPPLNVMHKPVFMFENNQMSQEEALKLGTLQKLDSDLSSLISGQQAAYPQLNFQQSSYAQNYQQPNYPTIEQQPRFLQNKPEINKLSEPSQNKQEFSKQADNFVRTMPVGPVLREEPLNFHSAENVECQKKEGMLKIRDADQKNKEVQVTYTILTSDRLTYFINPVFI